MSGWSDLKAYCTAIALTASMALTGCETLLDPFGANKEVILPGKRLAVLSERRQLNVSATAAQKAYTPPLAQRLDAWTQPYANSQHLVANINSGGVLGKPLRLVWRADTGLGQSSVIPLQSLPLVVGNRVYAMDTEYTLTAFDLASGDELWRTTDDSETVYSISYGGGISYANGTIVVTTGYGDVVAYNAQDGSQIWRQILRVPIRGAATMIDNLAIVQTLDSQAFALDIQDGTEIWYHAGINEITAVVNQTSAAARQDVTFLAYNSGEIAALSTQDGAVIWTEAFSSRQRFSELSRINTIGASPVLVDDTLLISGYSDQMLLMQTSNGKRLWDQSLGSLSVPLVAGEGIFVLANDHRLYALEFSSGQVRWISDPNHVLALYNQRRQQDASNEDNQNASPVIADKDVPRRHWSAPLMIDSRLVLISQEGDFLQLDPQDGQLLAYEKLNKGSAYPPVVVNGYLLILSPQGELSVYQ